MEVDNVKIALLGLPEAHRLALLGLPPGTSVEEARRALALVARRELGESDGGETTPERLAAKQALARFGDGATLDDEDAEHVRALGARSDAARHKLMRVEEQLEAVELRQADCSRRVSATPGQELRRLRNTVIELRTWVAVLSVVETVFALPLAAQLSGLTQYPDYSFVPPDVWAGCAALMAALLIALVVAPVVAAHKLRDVQLTVWGHRAAMGAAAAIIAVGVGAVAFARIASVLHGSGQTLLPAIAVGVVLVVSTFVAAGCVLAFETEASSASRRLAQLRSVVSDAEGARGALDAERRELMERRSALLAEVEAPQVERAKFRDRLRLAQRELEREELALEEIVERGVRVFAAMERLSPAGRKHLGTLFRIVDLPAVDAVPASEV